MYKRDALLKKRTPGGMKAFVVQAGPERRMDFALQLEYPDKGNKKGYARAVSGRYFSVSACMDISVSSWLVIAVDSQALGRQG